jgi:GT2 family glycosyltransferase
VATPEISVVVPSHNRRLRLRWLLNALEEQTLGRERFEVVVVHDYDDADTRDLFDRHPLAEAGVLRHERIEPGTGAPARQRNIGWRAARAPLILFTDDDCRVDERWVETMLEAAQRHPGAIVQGRTRPDPFEELVTAAPHYRTLHVEAPPGPFAQTCNILYPRAVLEAVDGFDEGFPSPAGEDLDLAIRARAATGAPYVGEPGALVYHAVESYSLKDYLRMNVKWRDVAFVVKRHPQVRDLFPLRIFWRETHLRLTLALLGLALSRRHKLAALLATPYLKYALDRRGRHPAGRLVAAIELPGRTIVDAAEIATLVWGSARYRTLVL